MGNHGAGRAGLAALELVIVITVLVLLTGVLVPSIDRAVQAGQRSETRARLQRLAAACVRFHADTGRWPAGRADAGAVSHHEAVAGWACLLDNVLACDGWRGPYLEDPDAPGLDAWGGPIQAYLFAADYCRSGGGLVLVSAGPDGIVDSTLTAILSGSPLDDDLLHVVTIRL